MKLTINGKEVCVKSATIEELINELSVPKEGLAVAKNEEIIPRLNYEQTNLSEGDELEIIRPIGGG